MAYRVVLFILTLLFMACSKQTKVPFDPKPISFKTPPNGYRLDSNLFVDRSEVSNINYKLYLNYIERTLGNDHELFNKSAIDTTVWRDVEKAIIFNVGKYKTASELFEAEYFRNASFDDHPLVGVSYDQAVLFTEWRTQRVFEIILIGNGYMEPNVRRFDPNISVIDEYFNHRIEGAKVLDTLQFPYFSLIESVEILRKVDVGYIYSYDHYNHYLKDEEVQFTLPNFKGAYEPQRLLGNVAEMTSKKGVAFGGSWAHPLEQCHLDSVQNYEGPKNWLGFRNVSRFVNYEEYKKLKSNNRID